MGPTIIKDIVVCVVLEHVSALEALRNAYINLLLLLLLLNHLISRELTAQRAGLVRASPR